MSSCPFVLYGSHLHSVWGRACQNISPESWSRSSANSGNSSRCIQGGSSFVSVSLELRILVRVTPSTLYRISLAATQPVTGWNDALYSANIVASFPRRIFFLSLFSFFWGRKSRDHGAFFNSCYEAVRKAESISRSDSVHPRFSGASFIIFPLRTRVTLRKDLAKKEMLRASSWLRCRRNVCFGWKAFLCFCTHRYLDQKPFPSESIHPVPNMGKI